MHDGSMDEANDVERAGDGAGHGRRAFLRKVGVGAAVAWTAPVVLSNPASAGPGSVLGAPTLVGGNGGTVPGGTADLALTLPTGTANGDLLLVVVSVATSSTVATPLGWSLLSGPNDTAGFLGGNSRSYVFAYEGATASVASTTFTRTGTGGNFRGAIAAYGPGGGGAGVAIDAVATPNNNGYDNTPPFPGITIGGVDRTVVYLGNSGTAGTRTWSTPNPGGDVAVQTVAADNDVTITSNTDVDVSPGGVDGTLSGGSFSGIATTSTYAVALVTI